MLPHTRINKLDQSYSQLIESGSDVKTGGWVRTARKQKSINFITITDGSTAQGVQIVVGEELEQQIKDFAKINIGTSLVVVGQVVKSPGAGQSYEIKARSIEILGFADLESYPLAKGRLPLEYLRTFPHLRARTLTYSCVFRIKSSISQATHQFYKSRGFAHVNPNIITVNECEGGAGVFQVTELDISDHGKLPTTTVGGKLHDWSRDHFSRPAYLTVSSQLQLEALACSMGSVYTTNKSFRSEHSNTAKHLSEFEHLEIEDIFLSLDELMQIGEDYIKFVASYLLANNMDDLMALNKFVSVGIIDRIKQIVDTKFIRITYTEAIKLLQDSKKFNPAPKYSEDLSSEYENYLTEHFGAPVFVTHWPLAIKSFYMKRHGPELCENFDLLMGYKVGELIGGSMREDNLENLMVTIKEKNIDDKPFEFYLDLRRYGTVPHGGFGLGLDRMCMLFTGLENIKDVVAFPVYYKNCDY